METIQKAIRESSISIIFKLAGVLIMLAIIFCCLIFSPAAEGYTKVQWNVVLALFAIIAVTISIFLVKKIMESVDIKKSKVWQALQQRGYADEFISSIDSELKNNLLIKFEDKRYKLHLFVTPTWFVFISRNGSTIRKTEEVVWIYSKMPQGVTSANNKDILIVGFRDGSVFNNFCFLSCAKIIEVCQDKLPNISYGYSKEKEVLFNNDPNALLKN
ncbi:MAG TPA: hypothetical protein GXX73_10735 [Clostridium sp.]|nr:hypothetical protein [Clostridium sp.]